MKQERIKHLFLIIFGLAAFAGIGGAQSLAQSSLAKFLTALPSPNVCTMADKRQALIYVRGVGIYECVNGTYVRNTGNSGGGDVSLISGVDATNFPTLNAAIASIGTTVPTNLFITNPTTTGTAAVTLAVPRNITLYFTNRGVLNVPNGVTVEPLGLVTANRHQKIFELAQGNTAQVETATVQLVGSGTIAFDSSIRLYFTRGGVTDGSLVSVATGDTAKTVAAKIRAAARATSQFNKYTISGTGAKIILTSKFIEDGNDATLNLSIDDYYGGNEGDGGPNTQNNGLIENFTSENTTAGETNGKFSFYAAANTTVYPEWWGATGTDDGAADDDDFFAIQTAIKSIEKNTGNYLNSSKVKIVEFQAKRYRSSARLVMRGAAHLRGAGKKVLSGTQIDFFNPTGGIVVGDVNVSGATFSANDSTIEQMAFVGTLATTNYVAANIGIQVASHSTIREVFVSSFEGHGVLINGIQAPNGQLTNANSTQVLQLHANGNNGNGLHLAGNDANVANVSGYNGYYNRGWGVYDDSFLGSHFEACDVADNTLGGYATAPAQEIQSSTFIGCYAEVGQNSYFNRGTVVLGGNLLNDPSNSIGGNGFVLGGNGPGAAAINATPFGVSNTSARFGVRFFLGSLVDLSGFAKSNIAFGFGKSSNFAGGAIPYGVFGWNPPNELVSYGSWKLFMGGANLVEIGDFNGVTGNPFMGFPEGIVLTAPNGNKFKVTVSNEGVLATTPFTP